MTTPTITYRKSGILLHFSSLPSQFGIGDIGKAGQKFIDFLSASNQTYWQFLPTTITNSLYGNSPYMSNSAFAGNPLLLCPELLVEDGYLTHSQLGDTTAFSPYLVNYNEVTTYKKQLLKKAYSSLSEKQRKHIQDFRETTPWLKNFTFFMVLKDLYPDTSWCHWPEPFRAHDEQTLAKFESQYGEQILYYCFEQYLFHSQWLRLREYAQEKNILLFGDIPIYVSYDSADVWSNQILFDLNPVNHKPVEVSGVPPDYFSKEGQHWGNPLYKWESETPEIQQKLIEWWIMRLRESFKMVDTVRIDHFRGFESYWAIPAEEKTAINGTWRKGPGAPFFETIKNNLASLDIIAEDLGIITPAVTQMRDSLQFPGMKVLQFAFDGDTSNTFLPHNYTDSNCVVYTGTHDNDTTVGWFLSDKINENQRKHIKAYCNRSHPDDNQIHKDMIYLAMSSTARISILPMQDILGFGSDCRMNTPGTAEGNWQWRLSEEFINSNLVQWLKDLTQQFARE